MTTCSCGLDSHMNQITDYPVGAKVHFVDGIVGEVSGHCADGRAIIYAEGRGHTYHHIQTFVDHVELPGPTVEALQAENQRLRSQVERLTAQLD